MNVTDSPAYANNNITVHLNMKQYHGYSPVLRRVQRNKYQTATIYITFGSLWFIP